MLGSEASRRGDAGTPAGRSGILRAVGAHLGSRAAVGAIGGALIAPKAVLH